jgi:RHS repeat-associated protein
VRKAPEDLRFPGQWFQLETGLAYNWHRHYDATTGRYLQPDPLGLSASVRACQCPKNLEPGKSVKIERPGDAEEVR